MNKERLYNYIKNPQMLDEASLPELEEILKEYPYFQSAHLLYLKNLKMLGHLRFNKQLRISASYITDRSVLYHFLQDLEESEPEILPEPNRLSVEEEELVASESSTGEADRILNQIEGRQKENVVSEQAEAVPDANESKDVREKFVEQVSAYLNNELEEVPKTSKRKTRKKKLLDELPKLKRERESSERAREKLMTRLSADRKPAINYFEKEDEDTREFGDYIGSFLDDAVPETNELNEQEKEAPDSEKNSSSRSEDSHEQEGKAAPSDNLIDKFIAAQPRLHASVDPDNALYDISASSVADNDDFITDTLARIYLEQKHFDKAIHAYQKLSLKYPEKSIYFANQIKRIEELKNK
jgi:hypothetical protein